MSICRLSTDDFHCDLYCYESAGGFVTHVANSRYAGLLPYEPITSYDPEYLMERYKLVHDNIEASTLEPIGLPHDGESFVDETLEDLYHRMTYLRDLGYEVPQHVIDGVKEDIEFESQGDME